MKSKAPIFWRNWMSLAPLTILLVLAMAPMIVSFYQSFVSWEELKPSGWGTLEGYREILKPQRLQIILELVKRASLVASIDVLIAIPLADFIMRRKSIPLQWGIMLALNIPFLISAVSRSFGWFYILNQDGFLNRFLISLFPHMKPITWLVFSRTSVIITLVATTLSFAVFPLILALPNIRSSFWMAADNFGTSTLTRLVHLVIPIGVLGIVEGWFSAFWLSFGSSVEPSVVDGPVEISLGKMTNQLLSANNFSAVYALSSIIITTFVLLGSLIFLFLSVNRLGIFPLRITFISKWLSQHLYGHQSYTSSALLRKLRALLGPLLVSILLGLFFLAPVWSTLTLSLLRGTPVASQKLGGFTLHWYAKAFANEAARSAWINSLSVAFPVGIMTAFFGFLLGLTWWNRFWRNAVICGLAILALLPPDAQALGILELYKLLGFGHASLILVGISHFAWALPFGVALMFAINSNIDPILFNAGMEMKASRLFLIRKVLTVMTWPGILSTFMIGMLMSFNDYTRSSYLSGSNQMLGQYVYGQMKSGTDPSVYAIGGVNAIVALLVFVVVLLIFAFIPREANAEERV